MEVHLPPAQETELNELAANTGRGTDELIQEAVARLLAHKERIRRQVRIGIGQIERGEFTFSVQLEDIHTHIERALIERLGDVGRKLST